MSEWVMVAAGILLYIQGFMLGGIMYAKGPFWDGIRSIYRLGK